MSEPPSLRFRLAVGVTSSIATALIVWLTDTFPFVVYPGAFVIGPFALLWFLAPAFVVPALMVKVPLERRALLKLLATTALVFVASGFYLTHVYSHPGNTAADLGIGAAWVTAAILVLLAGAGYLWESKILSGAYHLVLSTWFFALAFPYTGEFL